MPSLDSEQLAARQAVLQHPDAQDCTLYRTAEDDPEAEEQDLGDGKILFCGPFEAPADWDAVEREEYFAGYAPDLFMTARIESEAKPGSKAHFTADIGDYVATMPGLGEVIMYYVHDYLEGDAGCVYVLQLEEESLD